MKILVTGANGFIGKHMCLFLERKGHDVFKYDIDSNEDNLIFYIKNADFIIHLAGINRPLTKEEFYDGNSNLTKHLINLVKENNREDIKILISSSIQASLDNDYGKSKKMAEDYLLSSGLDVFIFRLANVFGKWCRPNYNSAAATFCYNIANNLPIEIRDREYVVHYNYIDDIVCEFYKCVTNEITPSKEILYVQPTYDCKLGKLADLLYIYKESIESDKHLPIIHDEFELKLFKTFCAYLTSDKYNYNFASDSRGSFEELYKSEKYGQIGENISFKGIIKGGHYHTYKKEIFYTVIGNCEIKQKSIENGELITNIVSGDKPEPIEIKVGYTHSIENVGDKNSHTLMWISEIYDEKTADTFKVDM